MTDLRPERDAGMNFPLGTHVAGTYGVFAEDGGRPLAGKARRGVIWAFLRPVQPGPDLPSPVRALSIKLSRTSPGSTGSKKSIPYGESVCMTREDSASFQGSSVVKRPCHSRDVSARVENPDSRRTKEPLD
ncbi:hypothetical protein VTN00DRAFT_2272 [Thermoascus crustaceus]|uniref:uncharacterized protein n=1 Tax=Thermoascus crustaceus TaxID=5088 RepID=UPI003744A42D